MVWLGDVDTFEDGTLYRERVSMSEQDHGSRNRKMSDRCQHVKPGKLAQRDDYPQGKCNPNDALSYPSSTVLVRHSIQRWGQGCVRKDIRVFR
jgi:hypothetical protein